MSEAHALVRRALRTLGLDVKRTGQPSEFVRRRGQLLSDKRVELVLDVGANRGQFAMELRGAGYRGKIISFEPLTSAFRHLESAASHDDMWTVMNVALGAEPGSAVINVSENSASSSLLPMCHSHLAAAPSSRYVATEVVQVRTLDSVVDCSAVTSPTLLKLDVQGFEREVLQGASESIRHIEVLQMETSLTELYEGELLLPEALSHARDHGFDLFWIEPGLIDQSSGRLLQCDVLFVRTRGHPTGVV